MHKTSGVLLDVMVLGLKIFCQEMCHIHLNFLNFRQIHVKFYFESKTFKNVSVLDL